VNRKGCLKGTREIVLDQIELWTRDFDRAAIYWLNGLAGTGKSAIAQSIAERVFADGQLGASFFCSRGIDSRDRRNLRSIFPTLAVQLARKYPEFRSILVPLVQSDPGIIDEPLYNQMDKLIVQPLKESAISTVIVIDALDECEDKEPTSAFLSVLGQFLSEIPKVKFFITGRPESRILEGFRLPPLMVATDVLALHKVSPKQTDRDIRLFFRHELLQLKNRQRGLDAWPTEEQLDLLCERAAGLFVYATATVKFIGDRRHGPKEQLDRVLTAPESSPYGGKAELPSRMLDSLYTSVLQEALGSDPEDHRRIRSILGAVTLTSSPLSPSAIAMLLGLDAEVVSRLLSRVGSLIILYEDVNHPVQPFHGSFRDFIIDPTRSGNERIHISPLDHHLELLTGCLELLNRTLERNMCNLPDVATDNEVEDLRERAERCISRGLRYACESWHVHLVDAHTAPARALKITSILRRFLEEKFLFWLEVLSALGTVKDAVDALELAADWLEVRRIYTPDVFPEFTHMNPGATC